MTSESITITNHTTKPIVIVSVQDALVVESERRKEHIIDPKDTMVLFTNRVEAISWQKK